MKRSGVIIMAGLCGTLIGAAIVLTVVAPRFPKSSERGAVTGTWEWRQGGLVMQVLNEQPSSNGGVGGDLMLGDTNGIFITGTYEIAFLPDQLLKLNLPFNIPGDKASGELEGRFPAGCSNPVYFKFRLVGNSQLVLSPTFAGMTNFAVVLERANISRN
jgi:hypothetical protein